MTNKKRIKLFTHTDLDGVGSYVLLKTIYDEANIHVEYHNYDTIDNAVFDFFALKDYMNYDEVYITDISIKENRSIEVIRRLYEVEGLTIGLFDHHKTAEFLNKYLWANVDVNGYHSGTSLFYEFLKIHSNVKEFDLLKLKKIEEFVELVRLYDTWEWAKTNNVTPKDLNSVFGLYQKREDFMNIIKDIINDTQEPSILSLELISKVKTQYMIFNRYYLQKSKQIIVSDKIYKGYTCGIVYADSYVSELAHRLLEDNKVLDLVAIIDLSKMSVSLRSRDCDDSNTNKKEVDVRKIAEDNYGGGHKHAAGYRLNIDKVNLATYLLV